MRSLSLLVLVLFPAVCSWLPVWATRPAAALDRPAVGSGLLAGGLLAADRSSQAQPPPSPAVTETIRFEQITVADGLSNNAVMVVFQDAQGFLWFGTEYGLNKYDGLEFTVYRHDPGNPDTLSGNEIWATYEDREGTLWVGTSAGLDRLDRTRGTFTRYQHDPADRTSLTPGGVRAIYEDQQGTLWVGTDGGLCRYDRANDRFTRYLLNLAAIVMHEDRYGEFWVGTNAGLLHLDRVTRRQEYYHSDPTDPTALSSNLVYAIYEDGEGTLWVGTDDGLNRFDRAGGTFTRYGRDVDVGELYEGRDGQLWIGTDVGLLRVDLAEETSQLYRHGDDDPHSLSDDVVLAVHEDRAGVLWVGTANGVSKADWRPGPFTLYQRRPDQPDDAGDGGALLYGLSSNVIRAVCEDQEGVLWLGTAWNGLNRLDRDAGVVTVYRHDPDDPTSLGSDSVQTLYVDREGVLWVGTSAGLYHFDPQTETFVYHAPPPPFQLTVWSIAEDQAGDLWIGTRGALYRLDRALDILIKQSLPAIPVARDVVWAVEDRKGVLWVATPGGGIHSWDRVTDGYRHFLHDPDDLQSLSNDSVVSFYEDAAGVIWLGTNGGGLNRFDRSSETFTHYTESDGLASDIVTCILADAEGFLWLGTGRGLSRFDPRTETFRNYDAQDGLQEGILLSCFGSRRGEMFFGSAEGLYSFYPRQVRDNPFIPPVVITRLILFNQTARVDLPADEHIVLSHQENYLSFEFAALDYTDPDRNQYAYRLEGFDSDWVYAGTRRRVDYPDLRPGKYVFRVRGSNNDGIWNEEGVALYITIRPPFWQRWWFITTALLLLVGGVYGSYRWRVRSLEARGRELERQVEERTYEIERRRHELEALYRADEELYRHLRMEQVLQALVDTAVDILGADKGALMVWDEQRERLVVRAASGFRSETLAQMAFAPGQGVAGRVALSGKPAIVEDVLANARASRQITDLEGIRSFMQVPITIGGEVFGVFSADYVQPRTFDRQTQRLLVALSQRAALAIENAQLYEQARELAAVQERNRLAQDLHDSVTQSLYAATLYADTATRLLSAEQADLAGENLGKLQRAVKDALAEMRLLIFELRPPLLEQEGLAAALEARLEAVEKRAGLQIQLEVEGAGRLPPEIEEGLYRIATEALNNALKHARAGRITVSLRLEPQPIALRIVDDGTGFDLATALESGGLGLPGMRERAARLGGQLAVESMPGAGTVVQVEVGL